MNLRERQLIQAIAPRCGSTLGARPAPYTAMVTASASNRPIPRLEWFVDALVLFLPSLVTVALYLPSGLLMPARIATLALAALAVTELIRRRALPARGIALGALALFAVIGVFGLVGLVRYRGDTSIAEAVQMGFIGLTVLALAVVTRRRRTVVALVWGWLAAAGLAAVVGVWELATGHHLPGNSPAQKYGHLPGWNEISSFFDNPNLYAYFLCLVLLLLPVAWELTTTGWLRWSLVAGGALLAYLLVATNGRMALFTLIIGAAWWALRKGWGRIAVVAGIALTVITMALKLPPGWTVYRFAYVALDGLQWEGKSTWVRAQMVRSGWWMTQESDYLGVGPGGYAVQAFHPDNPYKYEQLNNAHWGMVEVMAEYGVVSLIAVLAALIVALVFIAKSLRALPSTARFDRAVAHAAGILALTVPVISISHSTWLRQPLTAVHLGTLAALLTWTAISARRAGAQ